MVGGRWLIRRCLLGGRLKDVGRVLGMVGCKVVRNGWLQSELVGRIRNNDVSLMH